MIPEHVIRQRSYEIWQLEGRPEGKTAEHWLRAKTELEIEYRVAAFPWAGSDRRGIVAPCPPISQPPKKIVSRPVPR